MDKKEFVTDRARGAYIAAVCRPYLTSAFSSSSQIISPDSSAVKALNKNLDLAKTQLMDLNLLN